MASTTSDKLRDLVSALAAGKSPDPRELAAALDEGADRIDKLETLRDAVEQTAWTNIFANVLNGYLADPTIQIDTSGMRDLMLNNCRELADHGLLHWRHRWAGGEAPRGFRESGELYPLAKPALQDIWTMGADQPLETKENTRKHVTTIVAAIDALDEKEKAAKTKRRAAVASPDGSVPTKRKRKRDGVEAPSDAAEEPVEESAGAEAVAPAAAAPPPPVAAPTPSTPPAAGGLDDDGCTD